MVKRSDKTNTGEGGKGKKGRTVSDDAGGKSLSDTSTSAGVKSTAIRTSVNIFEASKSDKPQYFVDKVKDKRRTKGNNLEFLIGWRGFPDPNHDTWEPLHHLSGSEHMIREFNQQWEKDYVRKTAETLEAQAARRKSAAEQNAQREDIDEAMGEGGGDEEEDGESEDDNEDGHGSGGVAKRPGTQRRKLRSFYFRTGAVVRTTADNGRDVTAQCQVGGHVDCKKILIMPNGGTQVVQSHFLKCHTELNVMIRGLQNTVGADQDPPHFLKLLTTEKPHTVVACGVM